MSAGRRILLADDDPRDVELSLLALENRNLSSCVDVLHDGEAVLDFLHCRGQYASRADALPAVLVLDLQMPKLGGLEVLKHIKGDPSLRTLPVVAFTSSRHEKDLQECYASGVNSYVVKPLDFADFMRTVEELGTFWMERNVNPPRHA